MKRENNAIAKVMEHVARKSVKVATNSRCMYLLHQPKQPTDIKNFK